MTGFEKVPPVPEAFAVTKIELSGESYHDSGVPGKPEPVQVQFRVS
jgi:hypothetical protein